jgi:hypothetical protein
MFCGILKHLQQFYHKIRGFKYDVKENYLSSYIPFITLFMCKHGWKDFLTKLVQNNRNYNTQKNGSTKSYKIAMFKHKP